MTNDHAENIERLLREADECEMLGGLAVDRDIRLINRERARQLRAMAESRKLRAVWTGRTSNSR